MGYKTSLPPLSQNARGQCNAGTTLVTTLLDTFRISKLQLSCSNKLRVTWGYSGWYLPFNLHFSFFARIDAVTYNIVFYFFIIFTSQVTALCQYRDNSVPMNSVWNIFLHGALTWLLLWLSHVFVIQNKHISLQYNTIQKEKERERLGGWIWGEGIPKV